ncbi:MAG: ATP-binding cassette domain-containing protein [Caldilinea sp.]|nr:ATP-binding cassette domain-containing protein [Caldilinea sp.]MCB0050808.1 ATP-binding cassette domain-containing protein [Caldilinea sp.]MCO5208657.1 ATP-binding cassette domain-containing protein [Caldilinea sp.]
MSEPLLKVEGLRKLFAIGRGGFRRGAPLLVHAVDGVSFEIAAGEALAVVGESGCGKSTLALTLMGLETATAGSVRFDGRELVGLGSGALKETRRRIQMIFQDPYESLNPLMTVGEIVAEPLHVHGLAKAADERQQRVMQALADAGLKPADHYIHRFPHELSGGQRQRVAIAAALVLEPQLLIADEPVSMLDVSIRAEILNLLADLKQTRNIAILFITHDLGTVSAVADRIAVMYLGRIVETGTVAEVMTAPQHPYTRALLSVVPAPNPRLRRQHIILQGETPDPIHLPPGCRFHPRCRIATDQCRTVDPALAPTTTGQLAACIHLDTSQ